MREAVAAGAVAARLVVDVRHDVRGAGVARIELEGAFGALRGLGVEAVLFQHEGVSAEEGPVVRELRRQAVEDRLGLQARVGQAAEEKRLRQTIHCKEVAWEGLEVLLEQRDGVERAAAGRRTRRRGLGDRLDQRSFALRGAADALASLRELLPGRGHVGALLVIQPERDVRHREAIVRRERAAETLGRVRVLRQQEVDAFDVGVGGGLRRCREGQTVAVFEHREPPAAST